MRDLFSPEEAAPGRVWAVGPLMRAVADTLAARFNPLQVRGEVSGFSRAASGHCYFSLKDDSGQVRCAMFRRSAEQLGFAPADGQQVQAAGKLDVYGSRGDLQLIVDSLQPVGQGAWFEQFVRLKAQLEAEGLFAAERKRVLPAHPRAIGVVTSLGAAALRDVVTALRRRAPHLPVVVYPATVQGAQAPTELCRAMESAFQRHTTTQECDVLLLVRGGGSLEDLWAFNDAQVVRTIARAPMPVVVGVGHETDFTLADFVADLRAPTPTAAAELCAPEREAQVDALNQWERQSQAALFAALDQCAQRLDRLAQRLGQPSTRLHQGAHRLGNAQHQLDAALRSLYLRQSSRLEHLQADLPKALQRAVQHQRARLERGAAALALLDPQVVLERGFAYLSDVHGHAVTRAAALQSGQSVQATLADGRLTLTVER